MTFYWWSHWFWITLFCYVLTLTIVQTYPSQEISLEYNQNINKQSEKLAQTATTTATTATTKPTTTTTTTAASVTATVTAENITATTSTSQASSISPQKYDHTKAIDTQRNSISEGPAKINIDPMTVLALNDAMTDNENESDEILLATGDDIPITLNEKPERLEGNITDDEMDNDDMENDDDVDDDDDGGGGGGGGGDLIKIDERNYENEYKRSAEHFKTNHTVNNYNDSGLHRGDKKQNSEIMQLTKDSNERNDEITDLSSKKPLTTHSPSNSDSTEEQAVVTALAVKAKRHETEINNFTNFSNTASELSANANVTAAVVENNATLSGGTPATPQIFNSEASHAAAEWFNAAVSQLPSETASKTKQTDENIDDVDDNITAASQKIPFTLENVNKHDELHRAESEHRTRKSKGLTADYKQINRYINYSTDSKSLLARSASTAPNEFDADTESNISSEALSIQRTYFLDAGAISAICFTIFGVCCTVGTVGIVLYRRRYLLNKPHTLSEPDSSVYIDDSTMRVSDNSDEMYSLDNDSFLNSLEAMTIQNYWTDTVKHTKL